MAAVKDTFESGTFLPVTFGAGSWRGTGASIGSSEGTEFRVGGRLHAIANGESMHAIAGGERLHAKTAGEPTHAIAAGGRLHYTRGED